MSEFDCGVDLVDIRHEFFKVFCRPGPYNENVIYESLPSWDEFWCLVY